MTDIEKINLAFDILEDADIIEEFDDGTIWIKVDGELYRLFQQEGRA
jgi:hypothetical protein